MFYYIVGIPDVFFSAVAVLYHTVSSIYLKKEPYVYLCVCVCLFWFLRREKSDRG